MTEDAVAVGRVGDVGPSAASLHDQGLALASAAGAKPGRSRRRTAPTVLATCHQPRRRGHGRPRARPPRRRDHGAPLHRGCGRSEVSSARYAARVASWSPRPSSQASRRRSAPGQTRRPPLGLNASSSAAGRQGRRSLGPPHPRAPIISVMGQSLRNGYNWARWGLTNAERQRRWRERRVGGVPVQERRPARPKPRPAR